MRRFAFPLFLMVLVIAGSAGIARIQERRTMQLAAIRAVVGEYADEIVIRFPTARIVDPVAEEVDVEFRAGFSTCAVRTTGGRVSGALRCDEIKEG